MSGQRNDVFGAVWSISWIFLGWGVTLRFSEFDLSIGARRLRRGGSPVHLTPKAFELLVALIERRPDAVTKRDLHELLWPETFVAESNLAALVNEVRNALGESAARSRFVRTVPRFGYAFCGDVVEEASASRRPGTKVSCWLILETSRIELVEGENLVGRDPLAEAWIDLPSVSRRHARITIANGEAWVEDLGSKNGTCVRGTVIDAPEMLRDRDPIRFGSITATFRAWQALEGIGARTLDTE